MTSEATQPVDGHVHTQWSWDAPGGSMERSCERALALGLPAIAFTEHVDHTVWTLSDEGRAGLPDGHPVGQASDGRGQVTPPAFDVAGYWESIDRCRQSFPDLRILSGVELGEPHLHVAEVERVLASGPFDRVIGSLHCLPDGPRFQEPGDLFTHRDADEVMRSYLAGVVDLVDGSDHFAVLGHLDYAVRSWPGGSAAFEPRRFEEEFRAALWAAARSERALEINTVVPLSATILGWWREEGGQAVSFGSDAHHPDAVARGFAAAAAMAEAHGFRPGRDPLAWWPRG